MTRIAVDAMGGDYAPSEIVKGAVWAAHDYNVPIELVGQVDKIQKVLNEIARKGIRSNRGGYFFKRIKVDLSKLDIKLTQADEIIEMGEAVGTAIRKKKNSSIVLTVDAVAKGSSDAVVAAGSTGAAMASALFGLGRIRGIERPAIAATLPTLKDPVILIDAGANSESSAEMLLQFALMGSTFVEKVYNRPTPRVGILNIGEEEEKGNQLVKDAHKLLKDNTLGINFIGNVEGKELLYGEVDVVVCDGFVGNVALKTVEGCSMMLFKLIKEQFKSDILSMLVGLLAKPFLKRIYKKINYEEFGGALLLGVKGITVISHGRSSSYAIKNAVRVAKEAVESGVCDKIAQTIN
jgi:glycerol-3-phosphate acyltransferase PlsX